jgi:hypothetical protein
MSIACDNDAAKSINASVESARSSPCEMTICLPVFPPAAAPVPLVPVTDGMYNPPATARHSSMASKIEPNSRLSQVINWIERHPRTIASIFALLFAIQITPEFKMSPDGVSYMSIARSLIQHGRLERLGSPHLRYAPGYPIFIAPAFFFDHPFVPVQILQWLYALALMWGVYVWFKPYTGPSAIWIAAFTMANAGYWDLFRTASSEIIFAPCLIWAGVFIAKSAENPRSARLLIAAILFTALACATRQAGAMLVPGYLLALAFRLHHKKIPVTRAILVGVTFTLLIALISWTLIAYDHWGAKQKAAAGDTGYTQVFFQPDRSLPGQIAEGLRRQSSEIGRLLVPGMFKTHGHEHDFKNINVWIYAAVCVPVAIGWWRFTRQTADPLALMLPFYVALCVLYPYDSGTRFTVPVLAILAAGLWFGLKGTGPFIKGSCPLYLFPVLVVLHLIVSVGFWIDDAIHVHNRYKRWPEIQRVAAHIPSESKVLAMRGETDDRWMFLMWFTDRPVAPETTAEPGASFVDWIVAPRTEPDRPRFQTIEEIGDYKIETIKSPPMTNGQ